MSKPTSTWCGQGGVRTAYLSRYRQSTYHAPTTNKHCPSSSSSCQVRRPRPPPVWEVSLSHHQRRKMVTAIRLPSLDPIWVDMLMSLTSLGTDSGPGLVGLECRILGRISNQAYNLQKIAQPIIRCNYGTQ